MPVMTTLEFPGVTQALYEQVGRSLPAGEPPEGILFHACGPVAGGWRIVDVWESRDAFDRFVDGVFLPAMRAHGGPLPSRREVFETHHAGPVGR